MIYSTRETWRQADSINCTKSFICPFSSLPRGVLMVVSFYGRGCQLEQKSPRKHGKRKKESLNPSCLELLGIVKKKNGPLRIPKFVPICY